MVDGVPARVWLLIAIAAAVYAPALYLYRHVAHSPSRRDITQPPEDLSWRTSNQLVRSLLVVTALVALAVFIFTPAATRFARSPAFLPIVLSAFGVFALVTVQKGLATGQVEPLIRGFSGAYHRYTQPKRFWASMGWNALSGCFCLWMAFETTEQSFQERCYDAGDAYAVQEALSACDQLIKGRTLLGRPIPWETFMHRGIAHHQLENYEPAIADYTKAIQLEPSYVDAYYNRGLAYQRIDDSKQAIEDFTDIIRLTPESSFGYLLRGDEYRYIGDFQRAAADFGEVIRLAPDDPNAYNYRAAVYEEMGDEEQAASDFAAAERLASKRASPGS